MARKKFNWKRIQREFKRKKSSLPTAIGNISKNFFQQSFKKQGFTDVALSPWKKRKKTEKGRARAILVKSGDLRDSIKVLRATWNKILIATVGVDYGSYHNKGISPQPKRQFMGKSSAMNNIIKRRIRREIQIIFR